MIWNGVLVLIIEGYLDFSIGCLANLQQLEWETSDDYFNNLLVLLLIPLLFIFPPICYFFLSKNVDKLRIWSFEKKFGVLYEELRIEIPEQRSKAIFVVPWFALRRLLLAILILHLCDP